MSCNILKTLVARAAGAKPRSSQDVSQPEFSSFPADAHCRSTGEHHLGKDDEMTDGKALSTLGANLKRIRTERHWTLEALAREFGP